MLTFDTSCVNERQRDESLNQLEQWAREGRITIERSPAMLEELRGESRINRARRITPYPQLFTLGQSALGGGHVLAGPLVDANTLATILFPTTSAKALTVQQQNDIAHLQQRLLKTGGRLIRHARYFTLQVAENYLTRTLFRQILARIERLAWHPT